MAKLPVLSGYEVIKALKKAGFEERRQKGSHVILVRSGREEIVTVVPLHREVDKGTLLEIMRQARLKRDEFISLL